MRQLILALASLGAVVSLSAQTVTTPPATGRIEGSVKTTDGKPIANARILVTGTQYAATSDGAGHYLMVDIPQSTVQVEARAIGFKPRALAGLRIIAGQTVAGLNFSLSPAEVTLTEMKPGEPAPPLDLRGFGALLLRFQLIRPIAGHTTDKSIIELDSALRDLFQWSGYRLLSQAAIAVDMPGFPAETHFTQTSQLLNADGETYKLSVLVDSVSPQKLRMRVELTGLVPTAGGKPAAAGRAQATLLSTTVTVSFGHTVVLGSTQPGRSTTPGDGNGTLILAVRPEVRTP